MAPSSALVQTRTALRSVRGPRAGGKHGGGGVKNLQVHPVADLFPMMTDEELADLAEDIKVNGLIHPIVRDQHGVLIDGRNRLRACEMAGIEPSYTMLDGQDPVAFILSANVTRRHLSKGQQAMAVAKARHLSGTTQREAAHAQKLSIGRIAQADVVLQYAPELADMVLSGAKPLDVAYEEARQRKAAIDSIEPQMARLRADAPDLADLVVEERMSLPEALAALRERQAQRRKEQESTTRLFSQALSLLDPRLMTPSELAERMVADLAPELLPDRPDLSTARIKRCMAVLKALL